MSFILVLTDIGVIFAFDVSKADARTTLQYSSKIASFSLESMIMACVNTSSRGNRIDFSMLEVKADNTLHRKFLTATDNNLAELTSNVTMTIFGPHAYFVYGQPKKLVIGMFSIEGSPISIQTD